MFTVAPHSLQSQPSSSGPCLSHHLPQLSIQPFELGSPILERRIVSAITLLFLHMTRTSAPIPAPHHFHLLTPCPSRSYLPKHLLKTSFNAPNSWQLQHPMDTAPHSKNQLCDLKLLACFFLKMIMTAWEQGLWLLSLNLTHGLVNIHWINKA